MSYRIARVKRSLICLITPLLLAAGEAPDTKKLSLVVSGGISFGSYQAGTTWAILAAAREDEQTNLVNFTGASAGNVNAILGAIDWCKKEFPPRPEDSLLWELWTTTGIEQLMTRMGSVDTAYAMRNQIAHKIQTERKADSEFPSLFQRYYFETPETADPALLFPDNPKYDPTHRQRIEMALERPDLFRPDCEVELGVTVTSLSHSEYILPGSAISTDVQRQAIVFQFTTDDSGNGAFKLLDVERDNAEEAFQRLGVFAEPIPAEGTIPISTVMKIASASSAFPFAFSPVEMELRIHNSPRNPEDETKITSEVDSQWLLDGGVFDNKPLSLSLDLAMLTGKSLDHTIYIDQDRRRPNQKIDGKPPSSEQSTTEGENKIEPIEGIEHFGIKGLMGMLGNAATSGRKYELFTTGRYVVDVPENGSDAEPLQATDRYSRVAADHLGAFGAFLGRPLREHDFYAGVYDGLVFYAANYVCQEDSQDDPDGCVADWIGSSNLLSHSDVARLMVINLCNSEFDNRCGQQKEVGNSSPSHALRIALLKAVQTSMQDIRAAASRMKDAPPLKPETIEQVCDDVAVRSPSILRADSVFPDVASKDGFVCLLSEIKRNFEADPQISELVAPSIGIQTTDWDAVSHCFVDWDLAEWQSLSDSEKMTCKKGQSGRGKARLYLNSYFIDKTFQDLLTNPRSGLGDLQTHLTWWAWAIEDTLGDLQNNGTGEQAVDIFSMAATPTSSLGPSLGEFGLHTKVPNTSPPGNLWRKASYRIAQFAPTHMSIDSRNGGYDVVWQPGILFDSNKKIFVNLPIIVDQRGRDPAWGAGLGLRSFYENFTLSGFDVSFSRYNQYTNGSEYAHGVDVGAYFLGNRLRIGIGFTTERSDQFEAMASRRIMFGLSDPGGTAYWLARILN